MIKQLYPYHKPSNLFLVKKSHYLFPVGSLVCSEKDSTTVFKEFRGIPIGFISLKQLQLQVTPYGQL